MTMDDLEAKLGDRDYKRVASDYVGPHWVSTVWLGLDHSYLMGGPPLIFETMVFSDTAEDSSELGDDLGCWRWHTEHEAVLGHYEIVHAVRACVDAGIPFNDYLNHHS